jgi:hypothetical protein
MKRMRQRLPLCVLCAFALLALFPTAALAKPDTTILGLSNAGSQLDGQKVTFEGEVVGDKISADSGHTWLTVEDGGASISVYVTDEEAERVTHLGRYDQRGTRLEITGMFELDCPDHDGLTDVHATRVVVLDAGETRSSVFDLTELKIGGGLVVFGCCLLLLHWRLRERTR